MVQRLRLCASNAGDAGLIPGQETKIPHVTGQWSPCATIREACASQWRAHSLPWRLSPAKIKKKSIRSYNHHCTQTENFLCVSLESNSSLYFQNSDLCPYSFAFSIPESHLLCQISLLSLMILRFTPALQVPIVSFFLLLNRIPMYGGAILCIYIHSWRTTELFLVLAIMLQALINFRLQVFAQT